MTKCATCVADGRKSSVYPGPATTTLMYAQPFYDEEGVYHHHDMNQTTTTYRCSEGHDWHESNVPQCPAADCDWNKPRTPA